MACVHFQIGDSSGIVTLPDGYGEAVVDGKVWRWDFRHFLGPTWLRKDGELRACQCPTKKAVWDAFEAWHREWSKGRQVETDLAPLGVG